MVVALWGIGTEGILAAVERELHAIGAATIVIDQADVLDTDVDLTVGSRLSGSIRIRDQCVDLEEITALYVRSYDSHQVPAVAAAGPESAAWLHATEVDDILWAWAEIAPALIVSRPSAMAENGSKPLQLAHILQFGFSVPATLVTTDAEAARAFWERHGNVIYKSVSGIRSIVSRLQPEHLPRLVHISSCPTQLQEYIPGVDHRVHVVGVDVFACEIRSSASDYRYPGNHDVDLRACRIPLDVEDRCRRLAAEMQLPVAGIDLRRSPEGEWYCFEVNPSPGFTYYEDQADLPIGAAIARLLAAGSRSSASRSIEPALALNGSSTVALSGSRTVASRG